MMLGVDMVRMSWDRQIQKAVTVTAGGDFVQASKDAGVITQLYHVGELPVNRSLLDAFDESMQIARDIIDACLYDSKA